jgi:hypothetical protein
MSVRRAHHDGVGIVQHPDVVRGALESFKQARGFKTARGLADGEPPGGQGLAHLRRE